MSTRHTINYIKVGIFLTLLGVHNFVFAQTDRTNDAAQAYLDAIGASSFESQFIDSIAISFDSQFKRLSATYTSAKSEEILARYRQRTIDLYKNEVDWEAMKISRLEQAKAALSDDELLEAARFLRSKIGEKIIAHQKLMSQTVSKQIRSEAIRLQPKLKTLYTSLAQELSQ